MFLDAQGVVTSHAHSNLPQLGGIAVSKEVYDAVKLRVTGACRLIDGQVQDYTPPPAPPSVPATVTNYQARAVLVERGLFDKVDTALRSADMTVTANRIALQAWDYANGFSRNSAIVTAMAGVLGLSSDDVDGLFIAAEAVQWTCPSPKGPPCPSPS